MHTDKPLFTPGPLTTSLTVKQAMLHDLGSRDFEFIRIVREIRQELLKLAEADGRGYEAILMQGSGTFGIESVIGSITPPDGKWLFVVNGAYGRRMMQIAKALKIAASAVTFPESRPADRRSSGSGAGSRSQASPISAPCIARPPRDS